MPNDTPSPFGHDDHDDHFRHSMMALPLPIYMTDARGLLTFFNPAAAELAGRMPEIGRDRWCVAWRLRWPDGRPMPHEDCAMAVALRENRTIKGAEAIGERPNGSRFSFLAYPTPIRDSAGAVVGGVNMLLDITDHKTADSLRNSILADHDRKGLSILRLIDAVLKEAHSQAQGIEARRLIQHATQRVAAISAAQGLLHDPDGATRINSWDLLTAICLTVPLPMQEKVELLCESAAGDLASETAMPLALMARELIGNAAKHALAGRSKVSVRIGLRREAGGYIFVVEDDGPGFALPPSHVRSFGLGLVTALARQLNGTFEIEQTPGARCIVRFPDPRTLN
jgi:PAS domain S-box-containing protein